VVGKKPGGPDTTGPAIVGRPSKKTNIFYVGESCSKEFQGRLDRPRLPMWSEGHGLAQAGERERAAVNFARQ